MITNYISVKCRVCVCVCDPLGVFLLEEWAICIILEARPFSGFLSVQSFPGFFRAQTLKHGFKGCGHPTNMLLS